MGAGLGFYVKTCYDKNKHTNICRTQKLKRVYMKVAGKELAQAIEWVSHKIDKRTNDEYVSLVITDSGEVSLSRYVAMFYFKTPLTVSDLANTGVKVHMHATTLLNSVRAIKNQNTVELILNEHNVTIKSDTMNIAVPLSKGVHRTPRETVLLGTVSAPDYFATINKMSVLCETGLPDVNQQLESVTVTLDDSTISMCGTNRYVLGQAKLKYEPADPTEHTFFIPHEYASMIKVAQAGVGEVEIITEPSSGKFGYRFDDGREALFSTYTVEENSRLKIKPLLDATLALNRNMTIMTVREMNEKVAIIDSLSYDTKHVVVEVDDTQFIMSNDERTTVFVATTESSSGYEEGKETILLNREMTKKAMQSMPGDRFAFMTNNEEWRNMVRVSPVDENGTPDNNYAVAIVVMNKR